MSKRKRSRAERDARELAHDYTQFSEGRWLGETTADSHPATAALIRRFDETKAGRRQCPHLTQDWDQPRFWVEAVPELIACKDCTIVLAREEKKRSNTCCILCGRHVALRGITLAARGYVMRSGICAECETEHGSPLAP